MLVPAPLPAVVVPDIGTRPPIGRGVMAIVDRHVLLLDRVVVFHLAVRPRPEGPYPDGRPPARDRGSDGPKRRPSPRSTQAAHRPPRARRGRGSTLGAERRQVPEPRRLGPGPRRQRREMEARTRRTRELRRAPDLASRAAPRR